LSFVLDEFLEWLASDDKWHSLDEFAASNRVEKYKVEKIAKFFACYKFIEFKENGKKVKINPKMRQFIVSSLQVEEKPPVLALPVR
jgi:hypothetical protein